MGIESWITKGGADRLAKRVAQFSEQGIARSSLKYQSAAFDPLHGSHYIRQVPTRTQAQQAVFGVPGGIGKTALSGFGQLRLDPGQRYSKHPRVGDLEEEHGVGAPLPEWSSGGVGSRVRATYDRIRGGVGQGPLDGGQWQNQQSKSWAMSSPKHLNAGRVIETTARDGQNTSTTPGSSTAFEMPPAAGQLKLPF